MLKYLIKKFGILPKTHLKSVTLEKFVLYNGDVLEVVYSNVIFLWTKLRTVMWMSTIEYSKVLECSLHKVEFKECTLHDSLIQSCTGAIKANNTEFTGVTFHGNYLEVAFQDCIFTGSTFKDNIFHKKIFLGCAFTDCIFIGTELVYYEGVTSIISDTLFTFGDYSIINTEGIIEYRKKGKSIHRADLPDWVSIQMLGVSFPDPNQYRYCTHSVYVYGDNHKNRYVMSCDLYSTDVVQFCATDRKGSIEAHIGQDVYFVGQEELFSLPKKSYFGASILVKYSDGGVEKIVL